MKIRTLGFFLCLIVEKTEKIQIILNVFRQKPVILIEAVFAVRFVHMGFYYPGPQEHFPPYTSLIDEVYILYRERSLWISLTFSW